MKRFLVVMTGIVLFISGCKKGSSPAPPAAAASDRKITITVDNLSPVTGSNVTFTLTAGNNGPDATTGVSVSETLPTGYTLVSATPSTGSYAAGNWNGFGLASGATATLTVVATVKATGVYTNPVTITGTENDPVAANNSATATITPTAPKVLMVSTLAGSSYGYLDGTGTGAKFGTPRGLTVDAAGNVFVVDYSNDRIRKITPAGVVTTIAGSTNGFADGTGAAAQFNHPNAIAIDAAGNLYVADAGNNRIRKITPGAVVSTIAGDGYVTTLYQPLGVGVDASGNVYIADSYNSRIGKLGSSGFSVLAGSTAGGPGYVDGTGTAAKFNDPNGVVVDAAGNVFVSDWGNFLIRKITPAGVVSTFAGSVEGFADGTGSAAKFEHLSGPAIDAAGNIYVADIGNNRIRKITPEGVVSTVAGGAPLGYLDGPVATAQFANPYAVAVDAAGNIYVSDMDNNLIRKIGY
ncbi:hypothetical protein ACX0G9_22145 [Flavitalea flava]